MLSVASIAGRLFLPFFGQAFCRVAPFEFTPCPILKYFFLLPLTRLRRNGQVNELLKFIEMKFSYAVKRRRNFRVVIPVHCAFDQLNLFFNDSSTLWRFPGLSDMVMFTTSWVSQVIAHVAG